MTVKFSGLSASCSSCHDDVHRGAAGQACESCHTTTDFRGLKPYTHAAPLVALVAGRHATAACRDATGATPECSGAPGHCEGQGVDVQGPWDRVREVPYRSP